MRAGLIPSGTGHDPQASGAIGICDALGICAGCGDCARCGGCVELARDPGVCVAGCNSLGVCGDCALCDVCVELACAACVCVVACNGIGDAALNGCVTTAPAGFPAQKLLPADLCGVPARVGPAEPERVELDS